MIKVPGKEVQEDFYEGFWSERDGNPKAGREERDRWEVIRRMVEMHVLPPFEGRALEILDLGCGRGWMAQLLSSWGDVLGIDPLEASIERARQSFPALQFERAIADDLLARGFGERFNLIVSSEVIEHVPVGQQLGFLQDVARLLAGGGWCILTTPRGELWRGWTRVPRVHQPIEAWLTEDELDRLALEASLRVLARDRAHLPRRPPTWQGRLLKSALERRLVRDLPLGWVRNHLGYAAKFYQVVLLSR